MNNREWNWFRKKLAAVGALPYRGVYSDAVWGARRDDPAWADETAEMPRGSEAWMVHPVLSALEEGAPMGFVRLNDGECRCVVRGRHNNRDGVAICPASLRGLLSDALDRLAAAPAAARRRVLVGLPCPRCHGPLAADLLRLHPELAAFNRVPAAIFHHSIRWSRRRLGAALGRRAGPHFLVCSPEHDVAAMEEELGIRFAEVLRVDRYDAHLDPTPFRDWMTSLDWHNRPGPPPSLLLCCGIMGRVWTVDAFLARPDSVVLCLGSFFDDVALGRNLGYASDTEVSCRRCLRRSLSSLSAASPAR